MLLFSKTKYTVRSDQYKRVFCKQRSRETQRPELLDYRSLLSKWISLFPVAICKQSTVIVPCIKWSPAVSLRGVIRCQWMVEAGAEAPGWIKTVDGWRYSSGIRVSVTRCCFWLTARRANSDGSFKPVPSEGASAPSAAHLGIAGARSKASWELKCVRKQLVWLNLKCSRTAVEKSFWTPQAFLMCCIVKNQSLGLQVQLILVQWPIFKIQKIVFVTCHITWHVHWLTCMEEISIVALQIVFIVKLN